MKQTLIFLLLCLSIRGYALTVYGTKNIAQLEHKVKEPVFIQLGSFSSEPAAKRFQYAWREKTNDHVIIRMTNGKYHVLVGPFKHFAALQAFANIFPV